MQYTFFALLTVFEVVKEKGTKILEFYAVFTFPNLCLCIMNLLYEVGESYKKINARHVCPCHPCPPPPPPPALISHI
jgi:hypothetical protein